MLGTVESNKIDTVYTNNVSSIITATTNDENIDHYSYTKYVLSNQIESMLVASDYYASSTTNYSYSRMIYNEDDININDTLYFDYIISTNSSNIHIDVNDSNITPNIVPLGNNLYRIFGFYTLTEEDSNRYPNNINTRRFIDINYLGYQSSRKVFNEFVYINPTVTQDNFTDNLSVTGENILYKIEAVDKAGNISDSTYVLINTNTSDVEAINKIITTTKVYYFNILRTSGTLTLPEDNNILGLSDNNLSGTVYIKTDGRVAFQGINNGKCEVKRFDYPNVELLNNSNNVCDKNLYKNLVINGYGEYGDNTNFEQFTYNPSTNAFSLDVKSAYLSTMTTSLIPVNSSKKYNMQVDLSGSADIQSNLFGFTEVDIDKNVFNANNIMYIENTLTTLTQDLKDGDMIVYLDDLSNWSVTSSTPYHQRGFIFWNYKNSFGYQYPELTYSRYFYHDLYTYNNINKTNNTIKLNSAWDKGYIPKGTQVSQSTSGRTYKYAILGYDKTLITTEYQTFKSSSYITGIEYNNSSPFAFNYATKYIKIFTELNYGVTSSTPIYVYMKNIIFEEID